MAGQRLRRFRGAGGSGALSGRLPGEGRFLAGGGFRDRGPDGAAVRVRDMQIEKKRKKGRKLLQTDR